MSIITTTTTFHRLLYTPSSREAVLFNTRLFADIVELLEHKNDAVRSTAQLMSDIGKSCCGIVAASYEHLIMHYSHNLH
ncbi:hypothetical protein EON64_01020 [archaeon]|nr:MAG: hypothetical protein EON64_01020 [archaeon]